MAEKNAAMMLLKDYIVNHPSDIVMALENIIPFFRECSLAGLQDSLNTVNVVFASVALDVVNTSWMDDEDEEKQYLPVDATQMKHAIYYLSKFIGRIGVLAALVESNSQTPAFKMTTDAFDPDEICG